ncbi:MAG: hypothetical protein QOK36_2462 [Gaiellales bacterium]|jgi:ABC-type lipoprotein release transport system permease subunit|nr:hypothetical protein [Gaiellales bacterium]
MRLGAPLSKTTSEARAQACERQLKSIPGVGVASSLAQGDVRRDGRHGSQESGLYGVDPKTFGAVYKFEWIKGGDADLSGLDATGILLEMSEADSLHVGVGEPLHLLSNSRVRATVTVRGI